MRWRLWWLLVVCTGIAACGGGSSSPQPQPADNTLQIGALLSLTGDWSSLGQTSQAAMQLAAADVNAYFEGLGSDVRVAITVVDTKLQPERAAAALAELARDGFRLVIGPQSSAEVRAIKPLADQQGVLVVSQGSTAGSLAVPGDNIFRLCPDDRQEGPAIAALMWERGTRIAVGMSRQDDGNLGLQNATAPAFASLGGSIPTVIEYPSVQPNLAAIADTAEAEVAALVAQYGTDAVGVYLTGFDEVADLFAAAASEPTLSSVRWYGSDGVVASPVLLNESSAPFAIEVGYPCPIFGLDPNADPLRAPVAAAVTAATGLTPDAFGLSAYDGVWIAALAYVQAGGIGDLDRYKDAFVRSAETYFGVTGWTRLNAAGDRATGAFDFMAICDGPTWRHVGLYEPGSEGGGIVSFTGCPVT